jgi:hypothetical protein
LVRGFVGSRPLDAADGGFHLFEAALELLELVADEEPAEQHDGGNGE